MNDLLKDKKTVNLNKTDEERKISRKIKNSQARRQFIAHIKYGTY